MTAILDRHHPATPPALLAADGHPLSSDPGAPGSPPAAAAGTPGDPSHAARLSYPSRSPDQRARLEAAREERRDRWKAITEAGGIPEWVRGELAKKGVLVDTDPSTLSDRQKGAFKDKKRAEGEARRGLRRLAWDAYRETHIAHLGGVHWEDDQSPDKLDVDGREERARDNDVLGLATPDDLARALGLSLSKLRWLTYHREVDTGTHYHRWTIPKRDGSARTITAPKKLLKTAQRWALRHVFDKLPVHGAAHGFVSARSIVTNARVHAAADVVVKIDVKDFFPTVTFRRVRGLLRKAGLSEGVATLLGLLATEAPRDLVEHRGKVLHVASGPRSLPQGAPTSPAITNAVCRRLDRRMSGLARLLGMRYTRYADDLTFSLKQPVSPAALQPGGTPPPGAAPRPGAAASPAAAAASPATAAAKQPSANYRSPIGVLLRGATTILRSEGFQLHPKKTRIMRAGCRQSITGLVVNRAPDGVPAARVPRDTVRKLRAAIKNRELGRAGKGTESIQELKGLAAFVYMTDPARGRAFLDRLALLENQAPPPALTPPSPATPPPPPGA